MIARYQSGTTIYELGNQFGIDRKTVSRILRRCLSPSDVKPVPPVLPGISAGQGLAFPSILDGNRSAFLPGIRWA